METETSSGPPIPELLFQCHTAAGTLRSKDEEQLGFTAAKADHKSCTSSAAVQQHADRNVPCVES